MFYDWDDICFKRNGFYVSKPKEKNGPGFYSPPVVILWNKMVSFRGIIEAFWKLRLFYESFN